MAEDFVVLPGAQRQRREEVVVRRDDVGPTISGNFARFLDADRAARSGTPLGEHTGEMLREIQMPGDAENDHDAMSLGGIGRHPQSSTASTGRNATCVTPEYPFGDRSSVAVAAAALRQATGTGWLERGA